LQATKRLVQIISPIPSQKNVKTELTHTFITVIAIVLAMVQLGTLCYFGQRLTSASEEIIKASFENNWMDQPSSFKKSLLIIRRMAQQELKITTGGIHLNRENFCKVRVIGYCVCFKLK
jgi:hypothetical protein